MFEELVSSAKRYVNQRRRRRRDDRPPEPAEGEEEEETPKRRRHRHRRRARGREHGEWVVRVAEFSKRPRTWGALQRSLNPMMTTEIGVTLFFAVDR